MIYAEVDRMIQVRLPHVAVHDCTETLPWWLRSVFAAVQFSGRNSPGDRTEIRDIYLYLFISNVCIFVFKCSNETQQLPDGKIDKEELKGENQKWVMHLFPKLVIDTAI